MISHFIHLLLSMWFISLVSTLHTLVVARSSKLLQDLRSSRVAVLKSMHIIWIHYENPLLSNIVWLSLMRVTDWLNTLTWLQHNLVCSPPQSCGGGTLIDTTICFHLGKFFHANKWQNELAILSLKKCMLTALDRALAVYCAYSTIDIIRIALRAT